MAGGGGSVIAGLLCGDTYYGYAHCGSANHDHAHHGQTYYGMLAQATYCGDAYCLALVDVVAVVVISVLSG